MVLSFLLGMMGDGDTRVPLLVISDCMANTYSSLGILTPRTLRDQDQYHTITSCKYQQVQIQSIQKSTVKRSWQSGDMPSDDLQPEADLKKKKNLHHVVETTTLIGLKKSSKPYKVRKQQSFSKAIK